MASMAIIAGMASKRQEAGLSTCAPGSEDGRTAVRPYVLSCRRLFTREL